MGVFAQIKAVVILETAEIVSINPQIPRSWGTLKSWGNTHRPPAGISCTSSSTVSFRIALHAAWG